jgi:hypothetical protein
MSYEPSGTAESWGAGYFSGKNDDTEQPTVNKDIRIPRTGDDEGWYERLSKRVRNTKAKYFNS